jgi:hypothetical protein
MAKYQLNPDAWTLDAHELSEGKVVRRGEIIDLSAKEAEAAGKYTQFGTEHDIFVPAKEEVKNES